MKNQASMAAGVGFFWCLLSFFFKAEDGSGLCLSNGCALFSGFSIFGISLWLWGAAAFALLAFFPKPRLAIAMLAADSIFLAVMLLGAPCANCMLAGAIFCFCAFLCLRKQAKPPQKRKNISCLAFFAIWSALFCMNLGALVSEFGYYSIGGQGTESVYFSPSCATCMRALEKYSDARLYPVAESDDDLKIIAKMSSLLGNGEKPAKALAEAKQNPGNGKIPEFFLWRNKALVLRHGGILPTIVSSGMNMERRDYIKDFLGGHFEGQNP